MGEVISKKSRVSNSVDIPDYENLNPYLETQWSIDQFNEQELVEEIKKNVRRFKSAKLPTQKRIRKFFLNYKPLYTQKYLQIELIYRSAKRMKFDTEKYLAEYLSELERKKQIEKEEREKKKDLQKENREEFIERYNKLEDKFIKKRDIVNKLRSKMCGLASCVAAPFFAWACVCCCSGRAPNNPICQNCKAQFFDNREKKKYEKGPVKIVTCQQCFVGLCIKGGFLNLYEEILVEMKQKIDTSLKKNNEMITPDMLKNMAVEKEFAIFAFDNLRNNDKVVWDKLHKNDKLAFNFALETAKGFKDHPVHHLEDFKAAKLNKFGEIDHFLCDKFPDEIRSVKGTRHLFRKLIMELAREVKPEFDELMDQIFPHKMKHGSLKAERRIIEKLPEYSKELKEKSKEVQVNLYERIIDIIRSSYLADTLDEVAEAVKAFRNIDKLSGNKFKLLRIKNGFKPENTQKGEYPKVGINVIAFDKMVCEVNISLKILKESADIDHFYYEIKRSPSSLSFFETHYKAEVNIPFTGEDYPQTYQEFAQDFKYLRLCCGSCIKNMYVTNEKAKAKRMTEDLSLGTFFST